MALTNPPAAPAAPGTAPSRSDEATFDARAEAAWSWLFTPFWTFIAAFRAWYADVAKPELDALQADVAAKQAAASEAAAAAAEAAAAATNVANAAGTSTSENTIPASVTGSRTFVFVEADRAIYLGMYLECADTAAPSTNTITIQVVAWNAGTKTVTGDVVAYKGAGTKTAWTLSLSGKPATGAGSLIRLSTVIAAASATVDIEETFDATYDNYLIVASNVAVSDVGVSLSCRAKIAGTYTPNADGSYSGNLLTLTSSVSGGSVGSTGTGATFTFATGLDANRDNQRLHFIMDVLGPVGHASAAKAVAVRGTHRNTSVAAVTFQGACTFRSTGWICGPLTGIRFYPSAGTITGTFRLYGIKNS